MTLATVLFDADGPLCDLFAGYPAAGLAADLRAALGDDLPAGLAHCQDPHRIMRAVPRADVEALVTKGELVAAETATLTPGVRGLLDSLVARGALLAVVANNHAGAIRRVLDLHGVTAFGRHVYGRTDLRLMKDHPHIVLRAIVGLGTEPAHTLLVGDSPADAHAARRAGVRFVGYNARPGAAAQLRAAGATRTINRMSGLLQEIDGERMMTA